VAAVPAPQNTREPGETGHLHPTWSAAEKGKGGKSVFGIAKGKPKSPRGRPKKNAKAPPRLKVNLNANARARGRKKVVTVKKKTEQVVQYPLYDDKENETLGKNAFPRILLKRRH